MELAEFVEWMDANFRRVGTPISNEWENEYYQVEHLRQHGTILIYNRKNFRYTHFGPTDPMHAFEWLTENKDVRPIVPEQFRIRNEYQ